MVGYVEEEEVSMRENKRYLFIGGSGRPGNGAKPCVSTDACLFRKMEIAGHHSLAPREFNCEAAPVIPLFRSTSSSAVSIVLLGVPIQCFDSPSEHLSSLMHKSEMLDPRPMGF